MKQFFKYLLVLVIVINLLDCSGCSQSGIASRSKSRKETFQQPTNTRNLTDNKSANQQTKTTSTNLTLNQLFVKYKPAVFMVFTSDGEKDYQGSGFFISSNGIAVSNYHVFKGTHKGLEAIKTFDGQILKIEKVLFQNEEDDYIIFKVRLNSNDKVKVIPIVDRIPEIGEDVFAIGNPLGLEHTLSKGIISGYRKEQKLIQTTTEITHGSSGGPLINMRGEVVGITTSGAGEANINFAINIKKLNLLRYL